MPRTKEEKVRLINQRFVQVHDVIFDIDDFVVARIYEEIEDNEKYYCFYVKLKETGWICCKKFKSIQGAKSLFDEFIYTIMDIEG